MESVPKRRVTFFRRDSSSLDEWLAEDVEFLIILMDVFFASHSSLAVVIYKVVELLF